MNAMQPGKAIETLRFYTGNITAFRGQQEKDPCGLTRGDYALIDAAIDAVTDECVEADTLRKGVEKQRAEQEGLRDELEVLRNDYAVVCDKLEQAKIRINELTLPIGAVLVDEA